MSTADAVKTLFATLAVLGVMVAMVRALGKLFWVSLTRQLDRKKEILRRLRPR